MYGLLLGEDVSPVIVGVTVEDVVFEDAVLAEFVVVGTELVELDALFTSSVNEAWATPLLLEDVLVELCLRHCPW